MGEDLAEGDTQRRTRYPMGPTAVVVADDARARLVLQGLLLIRHIRPEGVTDDPAESEVMIRRVRPNNLLVRADLSFEALSTLISESRAHVPSIRITLILPSRAGGSFEPELERLADVVLKEPFTMGKFAEAFAVQEGGSLGSLPFRPSRLGKPQRTDSRVELAR